MKIYRYPISNPGDIKLVGEKDPNKEFKHDSIEFNISTNKNAEKQSGVNVKFDLDDYEFFQKEIIKVFKSKLSYAENEIENKKIEISNLITIIKLIKNTISKIPEHQFRRDIIDDVLHLYSATAYYNSAKIVDLINHETSYIEAYRCLTEISNGRL